MGLGLCRINERILEELGGYVGRVKWMLNEHITAGSS
jgi:hypothetical protein